MSSNDDRYREGLPDYHDPTAGFGGAPSAQSALTLRLVLAIFGLIICVAGAIAAAFVTHSVWFTVVLILLAVVSLGDIAVVVWRKRRGEPG